MSRQKLINNSRPIDSKPPNFSHLAEYVQRRRKAAGKQYG